MLRTGLIATKLGNSSHYNNDGINTHVTVLKVDECIVTNIKTLEKNGYNAVQLATIDTEKDINNITIRARDSRSDSSAFDLQI